ncbi:hypothetical protein HOLleu_14748 [Holothuria leucospilota]|uniref:Uncharacterized protein n=1 Tax=Holothuria leucospilota TaxID=206669 RepID=A0A9Q1HCL5_HOLLE|nr:hypothetical protein HOLleu_14748 [Holothuria leucospilota]
MAAPGPLAVRKVLNSSPALAKLKKHHRDHNLVPFTCGDFPRLCILQKEAKMSITRVKFSRASRVCAHVKLIPLSCLW